MTFNVGHVAGGSHAGWKIQKPAPTEWECDCTHDSELPWTRPSHWTNARISVGDTMGGGGSDAHGRRIQPAYMSRCTDCGTRRP